MFLKHKLYKEMMVITGAFLWDSAVLWLCSMERDLGPKRENAVCWNQRSDDILSS